MLKVLSVVATVIDRAGEHIRPDGGDIRPSQRLRTDEVDPVERKRLCSLFAAQQLKGGDLGIFRSQRVFVRDIAILDDERCDALWCLDSQPRANGGSEVMARPLSPIGIG